MWYWGYRSSRESSPHAVSITSQLVTCQTASNMTSCANPQTQKRSFSPASDNGVVPPIEDPDTPPPEGPIIRQAVAFSWDASTAAAQVNTYQASLPPKPSHFLPGQEVGNIPSTPATPAPRERNAKHKAKSKARHFNDEFSSQTGSFRLKGYINNPNASSLEPLTCHGAGPYSSMYRAAVQTPGRAVSITGIPSPAPTSLSTGSGPGDAGPIIPPETARASTASLTVPSRLSDFQTHTAADHTVAVGPSASNSVYSNTADLAPSARVGSGAKASRTKTKTKAPRSRPKSSRTKTSNPGASSGGVSEYTSRQQQQIDVSTPSAPGSSSHYRSDYERRKNFGLDVPSHWAGIPSESETQSHRRGHGASSSSTSSGNTRRLSQASNTARTDSDGLSPARSVHDTTLI
jgi:hypothetical protein